MGADPAVRVSVPLPWADVAGAVLMELLGPFQQLDDESQAHLLFYPFRHGSGYVDDEAIVGKLPDDPDLTGRVEIERVLVPGGWEEGWKDHFRPLTVGRLYVRPPWEPPPDPSLHDVVLTPGLAFGTGLHATTRAILLHMQEGEIGGPVLDAGTGSGILSVAAAMLGYGPVRAFDNDPLAVEAARSNVRANRVDVEVWLADVADVGREWVQDATVFANITAEPVVALLGRLTALGAPVRRLLAAGILAGEQEGLVVATAREAGLHLRTRRADGEWVSMELVRHPS